mgnify:CR=1 FL=1
MLSLTLCFIFNSSCETKTEKLFVGTFTSNGSEGLYSYSFNSTTGEITNKKLEAKLADPSFLTISENKKYLYTVEKTDEFSSDEIIADTIIKAVAKQESVNALLEARGSNYRVGDIDLTMGIPPSVTFSVRRALVLRDEDVE